MIVPPFSLDFWNAVLDSIRRWEGVETYGVQPNPTYPQNRAGASAILAYWVAQTGNLRDALAIYNGGPGAPNYQYADDVLSTVTPKVSTPALVAPTAGPSNSRDGSMSLLLIGVAAVLSIVLFAQLLRPAQRAPA